MAETAATLNILIQIGDDWSQSFEFRHGVQLSSAAVSATSLSVFPLPVALLAGATLLFDTDSNGNAIASPVTITLAANASIGATTITSTLPVSIAKLAMADGPAVDLTGDTFEMQVRDKNYETQLAVATVANNAPTTGIITASISRTITATLTRNCRFEDLPADYSSYSKFKTDAQKVIYARSYTWDLDHVDVFGVRTRKLQGRVFATPEATR